jgi:DNA-binding NtrC family response regulator
LSVIDDGTVVLENADEYRMKEQRAVQDWLAYTGAGIQLITTTGKSLFELVEQGRFIDSLFYLLNTVYLDLSCPVTDRQLLWRALEHRAN